MAEVNDTVDFVGHVIVGYSTRSINRWMGKWPGQQNFFFPKPNLARNNSRQAFQRETSVGLQTYSEKKLEYYVQKYKWNSIFENLKCDTIRVNDSLRLPATWTGWSKFPNAFHLLLSNQLVSFPLLFIFSSHHATRNSEHKSLNLWSSSSLQWSTFYHNFYRTNSFISQLWCIVRYIDYRLAERFDFCFCFQTYLMAPTSLLPDHLLLDNAPNIGPLISRWELDKFKNCCNKSFRASKILTLSYQQFSYLLVFQRDMSGPRLGALSNDRWSRGVLNSPKFSSVFSSVVYGKGVTSWNPPWAVRCTWPKRMAEPTGPWAMEVPSPTRGIKTSHNSTRRTS
jgi:hypothetical protein